MIKKKTTKLEITYELDGKNIDFSYEREAKKEIVKIGSIKLPYEVIFDIVNEIEKWKGENPIEKPKAALVNLKPTEIEDLRTKDSKTFKTRAEEIQSAVNESMENYSSSEQFSSLKNNIGENISDENSLPENINIEDDNVTGISVEEVARLGPVPETPPELKKQLQEIQKERMSRKNKSSESKKIKRV